jgi:hypothetical protein
VHYLKIYLRIMAACLKTFGWGLYFLYFLFKIPVKLLYVHTFMLLDHLFFPGFRKVQIKSPVFIIGHPRSASSFFHEVLTATDEYVVFDNWELHNPSLTLKKLIGRRRLLMILSNFISDFRFTPHRIRWEAAKHRGGLKGKVEEHKERLGFIAQEEEMLFLNVLDTQFVALATPIGFSERGYPELVFNDDQPHQDASVRYLKGCFKRQIYHSGKRQVIAKVNSSIFRIRTLLKHFPDAKFVFMLRSPIDTQRSHLSLHHRILDNHYGLKNIPAERYELYFKHRYQYNRLSYRRLVDILEGGSLPGERFRVVTYKSIQEDLWGTVQGLMAFLEIEISPELEGRIRSQHVRQADYRRPHTNLPLEAFGLSEEKIRQDFDFYFEKYENDSRR